MDINTHSSYNPHFERGIDGPRLNFSKNKVNNANSARGWR